MMHCLDLAFETQDEPGKRVSLLPHRFVGTASFSDRRQTQRFATGDKIKRNPQGPTLTHMCQITTRNVQRNKRYILNAIGRCVSSTHDFSEGFSQLQYIPEVASGVTGVTS